MEAQVLKLFCTIAAVAGLYYVVVMLGDFRGNEAALAITAFAALYGLFMLGFFLRDEQ
jgi:hypothetical protein